MKQSHNWKRFPAISAKEFAEHIEEENFFLRYGNPVCIFTEEGHEYLCIAIELYERLFGKAVLPSETIRENGDEAK